MTLGSTGTAGESAENRLENNPLLMLRNNYDGAWPFDVIKPEHFLPALDTAIAIARERIQAIKDNVAAPTFENTVVALENAGVEAFEIAVVYSNLRAAHGDSAMQALAREMMPRLVELESSIYMDEGLFSRVRAFYEGGGLPAEGTEERTLADKVWRAFRRGGAMLSVADKARLKAMDEELSTLGPRFAENVLKATQAYSLTIEDPKRLQGIPESTLAVAAQEAQRRGLGEGSHVFTLQYPCVTACLKHAKDRALRQELWMAYHARCVGGEYGNEQVALRVAQLRRERAMVLGYASHAHFQTEERMADSPEKVRLFLERLLTLAQAPARAEVLELATYARAHGGPETLMPWDYNFWANRLKEERFSVEAEALRPYFRLEAIRDGIFRLAERLYGIQFRQIQGVPTYAPDVTVYDVVEDGGSRRLGLLYLDFHPRSTKGGGAWCTRFRGQFRHEAGQDVRPHVSIVCNFTPPAAGKPSLLTFAEAVTLFHEFGHGLHALCSKVRFRSLSCTSVYRDFVELPSQIFENWLREPEVLGELARHYETGESLPRETVDRLIAGERFHAAYNLMRQLRFGFLDLAWFGDGAMPKDLHAYEREAVAATTLLPEVPGTSISCSFEHIFSGGYSAGYYGYKWAEVLDADAFESFKEKGVYHQETARRFRQSILERGGTLHPMELYRAFRGRDPDPEALLRRSGLSKASSPAG